MSRRAHLKAMLTCGGDLLQKTFSRLRSLSKRPEASLPTNTANRSAPSTSPPAIACWQQATANSYRVCSSSWQILKYNAGAAHPQASALKVRPRVPIIQALDSLILGHISRARLLNIQSQHIGRR